MWIYWQNWQWSFPALPRKKKGRGWFFYPVIQYLCYFWLGKIIKFRQISYNSTGNSSLQQECGHWYSYTFTTSVVEAGGDPAVVLVTVKTRVYFNQTYRSVIFVVRLKMNNTIFLHFRFFFNSCQTSGILIGQYLLYVGFSFFIVTM